MRTTVHSGRLGLGACLSQLIPTLVALDILKYGGSCLKQFLRIVVSTRLPRQFLFSNFAPPALDPASIASSYHLPFFSHRRQGQSVSSASFLSSLTSLPHLLRRIGRRPPRPRCFSVGEDRTCPSLIRVFSGDSRAAHSVFLA